MGEKLKLANSRTCKLSNFLQVSQISTSVKNILKMQFLKSLFLNFFLFFQVVSKFRLLLIICANHIENDLSINKEISCFSLTLIKLFNTKFFKASVCRFH